MKAIIHAGFIAVITLMSLSKSQAELIVLASPIQSDPYYADVGDNIINFHINYAKLIAKKDQVLIFTDEAYYKPYADALGEDRVVIAPMFDIWMRDFSLSNTSNPIMFRYTAEGQGSGAQGQKDADATQDVLAEIIENAELSFIETHLLNDGGNFVDDYAGNVVISKKFLRDNGLSEGKARSLLTALPNIDHVAFIEADEQGGLEHADGVVSFVDTNQLIINSYPEDPAYARQLKKDLRRGLPDVTLHEIVTPYDDSTIYDDRFGSACGLYTNALVTPKRIYLPQFGIPQDKIALAQVKAITSREVIAVPSQNVCSMGGGVRCMSWQLRGDNARKLITYFAR